MVLIGCDFHPSWQQVSWLDMETGETGEQKLVHAGGEAKQFYEQLAAPVLIGMETTGNSQWFIELVEDLGHQIWIGDAAQIRASYVRKQKTDKRDAAHILKLMVEGRFPRLWTPDREQRDLRQLVLHRHKLVLIRSRVKTELQHLSLNKGMQRKRRLWSQAGQQLLRELPLKKWAACRREDLLGLLTMLDEQIGKLNGAVQACSRREPAVEAFDDATGSGPKHRAGFRADHRRRRSFPARQAGGQLPGTNSTRRKFGRTAETGRDHQARQSHAALVAMLVEAAQVAVQHDPGLRKQYRHPLSSEPKAVAKVAVARKLAVRLYWMLRTQRPYPDIVRIESSPRVPLVGAS